MQAAILLVKPMVLLLPIMWAKNLRQLILPVRVLAGAVVSVRVKVQIPLPADWK
ncbi:hypothetical protein D3C72_2594690 [compost metagenome]